MFELLLQMLVLTAMLLEATEMDQVTKVVNILPVLELNIYSNQAFGLEAKLVGNR